MIFLSIKIKFCRFLDLDFKKNFLLNGFKSSFQFCHRPKQLKKEIRHHQKKKQNKKYTKGNLKCYLYSTILLLHASLVYLAFFHVQNNALSNETFTAVYLYYDS